MTNAAPSDIGISLAALANGIIPADERDAGAASVSAGSRLAERVASGINAALYHDGVQTAEQFAKAQFAKPLGELTAGEMDDLIAAVRREAPAFYKQLRMDVSALYLSDAAVWSRIGFPGPSTAAGGYPDFDQPQN